MVYIQNNLKICDCFHESWPCSSANKVIKIKLVLQLFKYFDALQNKHKHSIANISIFHVILMLSGNLKLWLGNLAWDFLAVKFRVRDF